MGTTSVAEAVITDNDADADWQLKDVEATLHPTWTQLAAIDSQMTEALDDTQCDPGAGAPRRAETVAGGESTGSVRDKRL